MDLKRVVVTGLGTVNPIGNTIPEFWDNALKGVSGAGPITNFDTNAIQTKVKIGCQVKNFDISQYMDRKEARKLDKYSHFAHRRDPWFRYGWCGLLRGGYRYHP